MSILNEVLAANGEYVADFGNKGDFTDAPR